MKDLKEYYVAIMPNRAWQIVDALLQAGATPYIVGGAVRDAILERSIKDIDIEVHGLSLAQLESVLQRFGHVDLVGKAYGVLRLHGIDIDWSVPRQDSEGRKPEVIFNESMTLKDAAERRDLTMNSMAYNLKDNRLEDPFHGLHDMHDKVLRTPNVQKFAEDPLRFWRVMQCMARFGMQPDEQLNNVCKTIDITAVSKERVGQELKKWLLYSPKPSIALDWLDRIGRLEELFPEIACLKNVEQSPIYHPEGDVYEHTKQVLDASADLEYASDEEQLVVMLAALCHDMGKKEATHRKPDGSITSKGHELYSAQKTPAMLSRFFVDKSLIESVVPLVAAHMEPLSFLKNNAKPSAYKRLAKRLYPLSIEQLSKLFLADRQGRNPKRSEPLTAMDQEAAEFMRRAREAGVFTKPEEPLLQGKDLMPEIAPGPELGKLLKKAYDLQIEHGITDKKILKKMLGY